MVVGPAVPSAAAAARYPGPAGGTRNAAFGQALSHTLIPLTGLPSAPVT
jgi:hypothetical protein